MVQHFRRHGVCVCGLCYLLDREVSALQTLTQSPKTAAKSSGAEEPFPEEKTVPMQDVLDWCLRQMGAKEANES